MQECGFLRGDGNPTENPVVLGAAAIGLIAAGVLAALSVGAVPPLQYGIRYNQYNKYADITNVYTAGRHLIGPWSTFLLFPASVQGVEFSSEARLRQLGVRYPALYTRTKEGLALHMQVSLQYRLLPEQIGALYSEFNLNYEAFFIGQIRDTLIRAASDYQAPQLWENRTSVGARMQRMINATMQQTYAECWGLQLMSIELPQTFDKSIVDTQVVSQNMSTMQYAQLAAKIRAETKVIQAEYDRRVKVIKAGGKGNYTWHTKAAKAEARSKVLLTEARVLELVKERLHLAPEELIEYQEYAAVASLSNASVFFGFDDSSEVLLRQPAAAAADGGGSRQGAEAPEFAFARGAAGGGPAEPRASTPRMLKSGEL